MIEHYVRWKPLLQELQANPAWHELEGLATRLATDGLARHYGRGLLMGAAHFASVVLLARKNLALDELALPVFADHLAICTCMTRGRFTRSLQMTSARKLIAHVNGAWKGSPRRSPAPSPLLLRFGEWLRIQKGLRASTIKMYLFQLRPFASIHGDDPRKYTPEIIRSFVLTRAAGPNLILMSDVGRVGTFATEKKDNVFVAPKVRIYLNSLAERRGDDIAQIFRESVLGY